MYARSVSPLNKTWIPLISEELAQALVFPEKAQAGPSGKTAETREKLRKEAENQFFIGNELFELRYLKGKQKLVILPWERISSVLKLHEPSNLPNFKNIRGKVTFHNWELFSGVKLNTILRILPHLNLDEDIVSDWPKKDNFSSGDLPALSAKLDTVLKLSPGSKKGGGLGFISLETDRNGRYWFKNTRSFNAAVNQSVASLELLADELKDDVGVETERRISGLYRKLSGFLES